MVVANVGAGHILVLHAGDALTDFLPLNTLDVAQHAGLAEIFPGEIVGAERGGVIGRQGDEVVEDACLRRRILLEGTDAFVRLDAEVGGVIVRAHQPRPVIGADILAGFDPGIENLLAEVQRPVEAGRIVIDQLGVGDHLADAADHAADLADMRLFGLDPQQVGAILERGDAVEDAAILAGAGPELIEVRRQALGAHQLAVAADKNIAMADRSRIDGIAVEEAIIEVANVARLPGEGDLLGETRAQRVRPRDDHAVVDAEFQEGVADRPDLREEVLMRDRDLAVLMAALLFVRDLILDLDAAGAGLDELLGEQVGRLGIAEAGIDVGDDRDDMGFVIVDLLLQLGGADLVPFRAGLVEIAEQAAQLAGVGLAQEGVEFLDQRRDAGLFMHRLVGQRAEFAAQRRDHPAREIEVAALGGAKMLLDGDHLLLADEAVPAAQRLGVVGRIGIIGGHVGAHDLCSVAGDVEAALEPVLQAHPGDGFGRNAVPMALATDQRVGLRDFTLIGHVVIPSG